MSKELIFKIIKIFIGTRDDHPTIEDVSFPLDFYSMFAIRGDGIFVIWDKNTLLSDKVQIDNKMYYITKL